MNMLNIRILYYKHMIIGHAKTLSVHCFGCFNMINELLTLYIIYAAGHLFNNCVGTL